MVHDVVHFFVRSVPATESDEDVRGPYTVSQVRDMLDSGELTPRDELCLGGRTFWAPAVAWAEFDLEADPPTEQTPEQTGLPEQLLDTDQLERDGLRWWLRAADRVQGPLSGKQLRERLSATDYDRDGVTRPSFAAGSVLALVGGNCWFPLQQFRDAFIHDAVDAQDIKDGQGLEVSEPASEPPLTRCPYCLETVSADSELCPECGEPAPGLSSVPFSSRPGSIVADPPDAGWLRMHWRPLVTMGVIGCVIATGIALRHLAPNRYTPPRRMSPPAAEPVCDSPCWHGEACKMGKCVWQAPNDIGHISAKPLISGPFRLPKDVADVLPLDEERFAVSYLKGVQIHSARTGEVLSLVSDAPQAHYLYRVDNTVYATSPKRIYVIDVATTQVLKTIEVGSRVFSLSLGANRRRALASIPGARAVAVIATDYHAEVDRFFFGDDPVGPVVVDDTGQRGLTSTGRVVFPGVRPPRSARYGALYAFDPSRLASRQDRVRTAMVGNPVDVLMVPDAETAYVVLREADSIVPLRRLPSGAVRQGRRMPTCRQPEDIELVRQGRRAIVRCKLGQALEVFDLNKRKLLRHIPLNARATDMVVSPDGRQVIVTLPRENRGAVGLVDLATYELAVSELNAEPARIRLTPDGRTGVVISDITKVAWVIR